MVEVLVGDPRHAVLKELLRWKSRRSPTAANELGSTPSIKGVTSVCIPPLPVAAGFLPFSSTPALMKDIPHLAFSVCGSG